VFEDTKGVIRVRKSKKDNTMAKRNRTKHYIENKRPSNTNPTKNRGLTQVLRKDMQLLLH
jgi:hypothetical protein